MLDQSLLDAIENETEGEFEHFYKEERPLSDWLLWIEREVDQAKRQFTGDQAGDIKQTLLDLATTVCVCLDQEVNRPPK